MLVSLNEIKKYVNIDGLTAEEIANKLTSSGIEVDSIKKVASATNLVIGHIIQCDKHPESDHLHVNKVDIGKEILTIVCGAPNCRNGLKVIVARDGAVLPDKIIKNSVIRGQESQGMLCALNELGVDAKTLRPEQISGIEELPIDAPIGETNVLGYLGLDDVILDLDLLANRSDAYSLFNIVKEIGALFNRSVNINSYISSNLVDNKYKVTSSTNNCKSFYVRSITGITISESPKWLKNVLASEGIRSINNIVDIGNYVMLLTGQPINMYDADKLENNELIVKDDFAGSIFAFDNKEYKIEKGDLVITNNDKVVCLAGIMTAKNAEIESKTTNIVIECANFYGAQIRKTSIRIGLLTDSAQRFIKGINPNQNEEVLDLITHFIKEICGYKNCTKTSKYDVLAYKAKEIYCSYSYINNRLGTDFSDEIIIDTLKKLYFGIKNVTKEGFIAVVPDSRIDVEGKADLSEEILRYNGFDSIKSILPIMETTIGGRSEISKKTKIISDYLLNNGLDRINDYTLINEEDVHSFNLLNSNEALQILHPLTEDHKFLRTNLLSSMLRTIEYNANYRNKNFGLFEISQINDKKESSLHLSIGLFGKKFEQDQLGGKDYNFYDAKGYFESICKMFGIQFNRLRYEKLTGSTELHPNKSCKVTLDGKLFAIFGELYPTLKEKYNFKKENIVLFEMNLTILFNSKSTFEHFVEVNKYPSISRDYAFVINKDLNYGEIKSQIKKLSSLISDIHIFDIYSGEHLINNKVSIAINVTFESFDHTLIDEEVNAVNDEIVELLKSKFDATMRS